MDIRARAPNQNVWLQRLWPSCSTSSPGSRGECQLCEQEWGNSHRSDWVSPGHRAQIKNVGQWRIALGWSSHSGHHGKLALAGDHSETSQYKLWHRVGKWQDKKHGPLRVASEGREADSRDTFALHLGEHAAAERGEPGPLQRARMIEFEGGSWSWPRATASKMNVSLSQDNQHESVFIQTNSGIYPGFWEVIPGFNTPWIACHVPKLRNYCELLREWIVGII